MVFSGKIFFPSSARNFFLNHSFGGLFISNFKETQQVSAGLQLYNLWTMLKLTFYWYTGRSLPVLWPKRKRVYFSFGHSDYNSV